MNRASLFVVAAALQLACAGNAASQQSIPAQEMVAKGRLVQIKASSNEGYVIGRVPAGSVICLQYVGGKWKSWGNIPTACPDDPQDAGGDNNGGDRNRLVIAEVLPSGEQRLCVIVPPRTADTPFAHVVGKELAKAVLRINDNDGSLDKNPGSVTYRLYMRTLSGNETVPVAGAALRREPETLKSNAVQQGGVKTFARNQSSIKGLFVIHTEAGLRVGGAQDIIATVERGRDGGETVCDFVTDVAKDTQISMKEAERLLKVRYPSWQAGYKVRFSYSNKYTKQAGGSAGGAFSVLLLSLLDGMQIDPGFGMTGDVTVDGKIREVGAVAEKLRGALLDKCRIIAIPEVNKENLNDLIILYSPAMLWSMQIFSIATLDDAAAVARTDRAPNLAKAMELFAQIQRSLGTTATAGSLRSPMITQPLREVLRLAPNHSSAEFMLRINAGQVPGTLSLEASVDEIWAAARPLIGFLFAKYRDPKKNTRYHFEQVPTEPFKAAVQRLTWLQMRVHQKTEDLRRSMLDFMTSLNLLHQQTTFSPSALKQHLDKRDKVLDEASKLGTNRKVIEEMMH